MADALRHCQTCDYDLSGHRGNGADVRCPECGRLQSAAPTRPFFIPLRLLAIAGLSWPLTAVACIAVPVIQGVGWRAAETLRFTVVVIAVLSFVAVVIAGRATGVASWSRLALLLALSVVMNACAIAAAWLWAMMLAGADC